MQRAAIDIDTSKKKPDTTGGDDEPALVERARGGDMAAFEGLYRLHAGRVHAVCLRLTGDPGTAEDCVQETFVSAWQHLAGFAGGSRFGTWLHRIAVNQALGVKRKHKRRSTHLKLVEPKPADDAADPLEGAPAPRRDDGVRIDLERAIAALPEQARKVFVLVGLDGYTHEEAGAALGIAAGTSKAQLHRARQLLMQQLNG
jgi:RNA polymerase sigma-70 factor (ECF subfamily)